MYSDVIELGSSDDEREPEPKKKKRLPNTMVIIPSPLCKPSKITVNSVSEINLKSTKTTVALGNNSRNFPNYSGQKAVPKPVYTSNKKKTNFCPKLIRSKLKNLPPSLIVTKTSNSKTVNNNKIKSNKVHTQNITKQSTKLLQRYKSPEDVSHEKLDQVETSEMSVAVEKINNEESQKFIEIEDSPVKPSLKLAQDLSNTITIVESPGKSSIKHFEDRNNTIIIGDSPVKDEVTGSNLSEQKKKKGSKKMLQYDNIIIGRNWRDMIEFEVEPIKSDSMPKKKNLILECGKTEKNKIMSEKVEKHADDDEFNAIYQKFIDTCLNLENSNDMQTIVEKKIKKYYKQCPKEYVDSEEFFDFVSGKIFSMESSPNELYPFIRDVVNELKMRRIGKSGRLKLDESIDEYSNYTIETSELDLRRQRHIKKLEKTLMRLQRAIKKSGEQEVDLYDEDNSAFLLTQRYKKRFMLVYKKLCQLTKTKLPSEPHIKLDTRPGRPKGPAMKVEKMINKNRVPFGQPLPFPDFYDVLNCVSEANKEDNLGWSEIKQAEEARELFTACGRKLKRRRQENEWKLAASLLTPIEDSALTDVELKMKLDQNKLIAEQNEMAIINKYVDKQNQLKLEPEMVSDKEAEDTSIGSDEEGHNNVSKVEKKGDLETVQNNKKIREREKYLDFDSKSPIILIDSDSELECHNSYVSYEDSSTTDINHSNSDVAQMNVGLTIDFDTVPKTSNQINNCLNLGVSDDFKKEKVIEKIDDDIVMINKSDFDSKSFVTEVNNGIKTEIADVQLQANVQLSNVKVSETSISTDTEDRNVEINNKNVFPEKRRIVEDTDLMETKAKLTDISNIESHGSTDKINNVIELKRKCFELICDITHTTFI